MDQFALAELPFEIVLRIVHAVDERDSSPTFPRGPSDSLLALASVNRWFSKICRPLIFRSIKYQPLAPGPHPPQFRQARSLKALLTILRESKEPIRVQELSIEQTASFFLLREMDESEDETADVINLVKTLVNSGLQVLFLKEMSFSREEAAELLDTIVSAPRLSALRFNQVEIHALPSSVMEKLPTLPRIRTLQIMHGSGQLVSCASSFQLHALTYQNFSVDLLFSAQTGLEMSEPRLSPAVALVSTSRSSHRRHTISLTSPTTTLDGFGPRPFCVPSSRRRNYQDCLGTLRRAFSPRRTLPRRPDVNYRSVTPRVGARTPSITPKARTVPGSESDPDTVQRDLRFSTRAPVLDSHGRGL